VRVVVVNPGSGDIVVGLEDGRLVPLGLAARRVRRKRREEGEEEEEE